MFEGLAKRYLSWLLRKDRINNIEIVISSDGWNYHKRNKKEEKSLKDTLSRIK